MTIIEASIISSETDHPINTAALTEIVSKTFGVDQTGEYIINVTAEATSTSTNRPVTLQVTLNGTEGMIDNFIVPVAGLYHVFSSFRSLTLAAGTYVLALNAKSTNAADTVTVRRIRAYAMKH